MRHEFSAASGASSIPGLTLRTIWRVDTDQTYDVETNRSREAQMRIRRLGGGGWVALRTLQGTGRIYLENDQVLEATENSLIVLDRSSLLRYHTKQKHWSFWWFEFLGSSQLHTPIDRVLQVSAHPRDDLDLDEAYRLLHSESVEQRRLASAIFSMMLHRWLEAWHGEWAVSSHQKSIWHVIDLMHQRMETPWSIVDMAREAGMSVRSFSDVFQKVIGVTPKQFLTRLRLDMASELLQLGLYNVKEVADRFGYSSPYHFSNAFAKHVGVRPSQIKVVKSRDNRS
jgi:AraC-like DNA-binding protein